MNDILKVALFIGAFVVVGAGAICGAMLRWSFLKRRGAREFQALADHFGLRRLEDVRMLGDMGAIGGTLNGHEALIAPDSVGKVRVRLERPIACLLRTGDQHHGRPEGTEPFDFDSASWNGFFQVRYASPAMADWLRGQERPDSALHRFLARWRRQVGDSREYRSGMEIGPEQIACTPRRGSYSKNYPQHVRFADVRDLLPDLVSLAAAIDAAAPRERDASAGPAAAREERQEEEAGLEFSE